MFPIAKVFPIFEADSILKDLFCCRLILYHDGLADRHTSCIDKARRRKGFVFIYASGDKSFDQHM